MSKSLPQLRMNLDFMPSPVEDKPGLLIRDSLGYSDAVLIVPPPLIACLQYFDGEHTELDLKHMLVQMTGELDVTPIQEQLTQTLNLAGFLHTDTYEELRTAAEREFAGSAIREPSHAGTAYPEEAGALRTTLADYMKGSTKSENEDVGLVGIAAPHVSPFGGWQTYKAAYSAIGDAHRDRTFVILGTSHYGEPNRFGLTRKPFRTPYGVVRPDLRLINDLADEPAAKMEDYCHAIEHSIEFQVVFLQHIFGPEIRILPVLCGTYSSTFEPGTLPESNQNVGRFLDKLGDIAAREGNRLFWVLGIDMAHMGARYGDDIAARAGEREMVGVEQRDRQRIDRINASDARGFWELVQENGDVLKWCGSAPMYTFLRAVPGLTGSLKKYEQWNIDENSVVSFGALTFRKA